MRLQSSRLVADHLFSVCIISEALSDGTRFGHGVEISFTQCAEQLTADALSQSKSQSVNLVVVDVVAAMDDVVELHVN